MLRKAVEEALVEALVKDAPVESKTEAWQADASAVKDSKERKKGMLSDVQVNHLGK